MTNMDFEAVKSLFDFKSQLASCQLISCLQFIILVLVFMLGLCIVKIYQLKKALIKEIHKRTVPSLMFESDQGDFSLYLKNDGACGIMDIKIEDIFLKVDVGFQKTLKVSYDRIEFLNPDKLVRLKPRIFDKEQELPGYLSDQMGSQIASASFAITIKCKNMENIEFQIIIVKEKDCFILKEIKPTE